MLPSGVELSDAQTAMLKRWTLDADPDFKAMAKLGDELRAAGSAHPAKLTLRVTLEGRRNQPVQVDDIRPVSVRREQLYAGTLLHIPTQDSGTPLKMLFDLDELQPRAREAIQDPVRETDRPGGLFFGTNTLTIRNAEEDAIVIRSIATRAAVSFEIRVDYRIDNQPKHLIINDRGRPFRITPANCVDRADLDQDPPCYGHVAYEHIWELRNFQTIRPTKNPRRFEVDPTMC